MNTSLLINDLISVLENVNKKGTESDDDKLISKIENNPIIKDFGNILNKNFEDFITNNNELTSNLNNAINKRIEDDKLTNTNNSTTSATAAATTTSTTGTTATTAKADAKNAKDKEDEEDEEDDIMGRFKWVLIGIGIFVFLIIVSSLVYYYYYSSNPSVEEINENLSKQPIMATEQYIPPQYAESSKFITPLQQTQYIRSAPPVLPTQPVQPTDEYSYFPFSSFSQNNKEPERLPLINLVKYISGICPTMNARNIGLNILNIIANKN
jgi:ribosomal protein L12E/L44/L45/RPP1/RPP2